MNRRTFVAGATALALVPTKALTALAEQNPWTAGHYNAPFMRLVQALQAESRPGFLLDMEQGVTYLPRGFVSFGYRNGSVYEMQAEFNVAVYTDPDECITQCVAMVRRTRDQYLAMTTGRPVRVLSTVWEGNGLEPTLVNNVSWSL